jgi:hypothetical protein
MLKLPTRLAACGTVLTILMLTALADDVGPTVTFDKTIGNGTAGFFDISFVKNDIGTYILADRLFAPGIALYDASALTLTGFIGLGDFVGVRGAACAVPNACDGPNGVLIDNNNNVWAADGPASACGNCGCAQGQTT